MQQINTKKKKNTSKVYKERNLRVKLESEVENSFSFLVIFLTNQIQNLETNKNKKK